MGQWGWGGWKGERWELVTDIMEGDIMRRLAAVFSALLFVVFSQSPPPATPLFLITCLTLPS